MLAQSIWGFCRKRSDHLELGLWPAPAISDVTTTLSTGIGAGVGYGRAGYGTGGFGGPAPLDPIPLTDTTGFLPYGYVQIDQEIIQYQRLTTAPIGVGVVSRGVCGTSIADHATGATVRHLGLWVKGSRNPATIVNSLSVVELPADVTAHLETYLLARCRRSENEHQEARALMKEFDDKCKELRADPTRKENQGQIVAYGSPKLGPLYWKGAILRPWAVSRPMTSRPPSADANGSDPKVGPQRSFASGWPGSRRCPTS